jgi:hypothetical protein
MTVIAIVFCVRERGSGPVFAIVLTLVSLFASVSLTGVFVIACQVATPVYHKRE